MKNKLEIFNNTEFGSVRIIQEGDKYLFCGLDVAAALGYAKPRNAITSHCRYALKRGVPHPQAESKEIEMLFIPEGDVYRLITHSKLPSADRFEKWVFDEVLPNIRKHGVYITDEKLKLFAEHPELAGRADEKPLRRPCGEPAAQGGAPNAAAQGGLLRRLYGRGRLHQPSHHGKGAECA